MALGEQPAQRVVSALALELGRALPLLDLGQPLLDALELGRGNAAAEPLELDAKFLRPLSGGRLKRERTQALPHLVLEVTGPLGLDLDAGELQLGAMAAALELAETGRLLDQRAPLGRLRGEDLLDPALADDGVHLAAEPDVGQHLDDIGAAHVGPVDEVLALPAAMEPARDGKLGELERAVVVLVVEEELYLGEGRGLAPVAACIEDVVGLLGAELAGAQTSGGPDDRVRDVRFARAVRADDHGDARLEAHLDRVGKRLEAAQLDRTQMHAPAV